MSTEGDKDPTNSAERTSTEETNSTTEGASTEKDWLSLGGDDWLSSSPKTSKITLSQAVASISKDFVKTDLPQFGIGDTVRVHAKIVEGNKERIQVFEGVVLKRSKGDHADATFTVRKISYNIGVERTFPLHSPRVDKIEVMTRAKVRRARLFYLRPLRGKATRIKTRYIGNAAVAHSQPAPEATSAVAEETK